MTLEDLWRQKSDEELKRAAKELGDYEEYAQRVIQAEMIRRGMVAPALPARVKPPQPSRQELLDAFTLTEEDLAANRQGILTPHQKKMVLAAAKSEGIFMVGFAVFFAAVMYGLLYIFAKDGRIFNFSDGISIEEIVLLFVAAILPTLFLIQSMYMLAIYWRSRRAKQVRTLEGVIELQVLRGKYRVVAYYVLIVGNYRFGLSRSVYNLLQSGNLCRIYYEPITRAIVAIESVEE